ncbi:26S proteasome non-ATPase regulatory subunit 6 [Perkinsus olseni]|nr:26S proteasome non-ATPase regulatory subunit 6 [Perkinsus olseni]
MDAISAGLPEEDTKTLPNMKHAQDRFILQCEDDVYSRQEKDAAKEDLMKAIREQSQSVWYKELCEEFGWAADEKLVAEMETKNEEELKKLELSIEDAQENLGDIEQRDAILNKGEFYLRIGDREKAVEAFEEALKITVGVGARLDNILTQIRMNIFWNDIQGCKKNIDRAHNELSKGGDWERRNKLKVYDGLYQMMTRDFEAAAGQFLSALQTFTATELMPFTDYIFYTVLTSMVATDRKTVMTQVKTSPEVLSVVGDLPPLREFLTSLYDSRYKEFFVAFGGVIQLVRRNRYMSVHLRYFNRQMRLNAYRQFLASYKTVTLRMMADAFGVTPQFIDEELSSFISSGKLSCKIDKVNGVVESNVQDERNEKYQKIIKQGDLLLNRIQKLSKIIDM